MTTPTIGARLYLVLLLGALAGVTLGLLGFRWGHWLMWAALAVFGYATLLVRHRRRKR